MKSCIATLIDRHPLLASCRAEIEATIDSWVTAFRSGHKLLLCGNGGSAADADHISCELLKGFRSRRLLNPEWQAKLGGELAEKLQGGLPAIPLTQFVALLSAYGNDVSWEHGYAQLVFTLGQQGDVFFGISTSGNARNVWLAAKVARAKGMVVVGLTGETGGILRETCDLCIRVPLRETFQVQELHLPLYHALCLEVEERIFGVPS